MAIACAALVTAAALLAAVGDARADIGDVQAEPSWHFTIAGPGSGPHVARDVAMTAKATWVAGSISTATGVSGASLARIPKGSSAPPVVRYWTGGGGSGALNEHVAARGSYVYTAGYVHNSAGNEDLLVIRWSGTGVRKWVRRWAGPGRRDDEATDVAVDPQGNVVVCGRTEGAHLDDWVVVKYSRSGKKLWTWRYDGPFHGSDAPGEMIIDGRGNIYVGGYSEVALNLGSAYTVKLSPGGKRLWGRRYRGPTKGATLGTALARRPGGGVYVGCSTWIAGKHFDMALLRYTSSGRRKVYALYDGGGGDVEQRLSDIAVASNGQIVAVGSQGSGMGLDPTWVRWDASGSIAASRTDATPGYDYWEAVATDSFGGVYLTGVYEPWGALPSVRTERWSVVQGGWWRSAFGGDGVWRLPLAMAVNGTSVAVVGHEDDMSSVPDQMVLIWTY